jgi:TB2/DP1, HVA22 family
LVSFLQIVLLMAYPSILTFRYLQKYESKKGDSTDGLDASVEINKEKSSESKKLLTFWAASGIFSLIDMVVGFVLSGIIFNVLKGLLIMWMVWPDSTLPTKIFDYVMSPLMQKYGGEINGIMDFVKKTTDDTINSVSKEAESIKKGITDKVVDQVKANLMEKSN